MVKEYRNNEEIFFSYYLDELKENGLITNYTYEEDTFELSPKIEFTYKKKTHLKTKIKEEDLKKTLLREHVYTPDFKIFPTALGVDKNIFNYRYYDFPIFIISNETDNVIHWVDIKGEFAGKTNSTQYTFPLNQKWMYQQYGIYVQKVKPFDLFKQTFTPKKVIEEMVYKRDYYKKGKLIAKKGDNRLGYEPKTFEEWIKSI